LQARAARFDDIGCAMELHGTILENLQNALASARRLRGHPVYKDTLLFWAELLTAARQERARATPAEAVRIEALVAHLESELAERK
jgi:hypothetical protein